MESQDFNAFVRGLDHEGLERMYRRIYDAAAIDDPERQRLLVLRQELGLRYRRVYKTWDTAVVVGEVVSIYSDAGWVIDDPVRRILADELLGLVIERHGLSRRSLILAQDIAVCGLDLAESNREYVTRLVGPYLP
jgi:hypothetical protein